MRMEKFTSRFQQALADAQSLAVGRDHNQIDPAHLLQALIEQEGGSTLPLLAQGGVAVDGLRAKLGALLDNLPKIGTPTGEVNVGSDLARLLNLTDKLAQQRKDQFISTELFVLALTEDKSALGKLLRDAGAKKDGIERAIDAMRGGQKVDSANAEEQRQALEKYTVDLTARAMAGKLDPVIGRDEEIRRVIQVLSRRTKNNPVIIGEPGVGKTAIVEGLAQRIVNGRGARSRSRTSVCCRSIIGGSAGRCQVPRRIRGAAEGRC